MKSLFFLLIVGAGCLLPLAANDKYAIPALNKVRFTENAKHAPLKLVENGKLNFAIVADLEAERNMTIQPSGKKIHPHQYSIRMATQALQDAFLRCFGVEPVVLPPDSPGLKDYQYRMLVGKSKLTDQAGIDPFAVPEEGFTVCTLPDGIAIVGYDGSAKPGYYQDAQRDSNACNGTLYGAYDFIERFLGMRFYYPGIGLYVPPQTKYLTIDSVAYTDFPKYRRTNTFMITAYYVQQKWPWNDFPNDSSRFKGAYRAYETMNAGGVESPNPFVFAKAHPDKLKTIFVTLPTGEFCYSPTTYSKNYYDILNPDFIELLAQDYERKVKDNQGPLTMWGDYLLFGAVDHERTLKLPPELQRKDMDEQFSVMSEAYGWFYKQLAEKLQKRVPGKRLSVLAYQSYLAAPRNQGKLPDNLTVVVCAGSSEMIRNKGHRDFIIEMYKEWGKILNDKPIVYSYSTGINHAFRGEFEGEFLKTIAPYVSQRDYFPCTQPDWPVYYSLYLMHRAIWNPDFDKDAAMEEHWKLLYGPAAPYLKDFYQTAKETWLDYLKDANLARRSIPHPDKNILYGKYFNTKIGLKLQGLLDQAGRAVKDSSIEKRRVLYFTDAWKPTIQTMITFSSVKIPTFRIRNLNGQNITVDGEPNEPFWKEAQIVPMTTTMPGEKLKTQPEFKLGWDDTGIYLALRSPAPYKVGKNGIWSGDSMEFFLSPGLQKHTLYQFAIGSSGDYEDYFQDVQLMRAYDSNWVGKGVKKAVKCNESGWTVELFVPFSCMSDAQVPKAGDSWFGNIVCDRTMPSPETAVYSTTLGSNHNIFLYGKFYFQGNCE